MVRVMDLSEPVVWPLGQRLRELRHAARWTQRGLAEAARVSIGVVRDLEQGVSQRPRPGSLRRLEAVLRTTLPEPTLAVESGAPAAAVSLAAPDVAAEHPVGLQLLGPLLAWRDGVGVRLGGGKQRAVLGLLGLHPDAVVSREAIGEVLWGPEVPPTAAAMIQSHLSRLRALLDPSRQLSGRGGLIEVAGSGYRLRADLAELDLLSYRRLADRAREAVRAGDTVAACELFEQALGLWRGEPVADVALLGAHPAVTSLRQQRADLVVEYAEVATARGWHDRVLPQLHAMAERDPLDERVHACLMIALAGSGRQAAALDLYERLGRRLDEQLGVRPGAALAAAHMQVLRRELPPAVPAVGPGGSSGGAVSTGPGDSWAAPGSLLVPVQLPAAVADFTGRSAQLAQLAGLLGPGGDGSGVPVVVVSGPPGVGKSALMVQAGHSLRSLFPDGQLWAQLDGASERPRDPGDVLGEFLRALGVPGSAVPDGVQERAALLRSRLADRRVLVAVDDAASAGQVLPLLPGTAGCAVLVTSRRQLVELPGARLVPLGPLSPQEAADLLGRIAGPQRIQAEPDAAAELAAGCGQLPLALRIAGAKLAARGIGSVAVLAQAVADERNRLDALRIGDLSVRASLASGYQSLSGAAKRAFRLLALLGPCDVAQWVIAALLGETEAAADSAVNELCDQSMLSVVGADATGQTRYRLHDLLRDYGTEELNAEPHSSQEAALHRAHLGWLQLATAADASLPLEPFFPVSSDVDVPHLISGATVAAVTSDPLAWFGTERLNLLAATGAACAADQPSLAARLAIAQSAYQHIQRRYDDAERIWRQIAAAAGRAGDTVLQAQAQVRFGAAMLEHGYSAPALDVLDACVEQFGSILGPAALATALYWHAWCSWDLGSYDRSRREAQRGVALAQEAGSRHAECMNLRLVAQSLAMLGQHDEALAAAEEALTIASELVDESYIKLGLHSVATTCVWVGEYERAVQICRRNIELCGRLGDTQMIALTLGVLGDAYHGLGRYQEAIDLLSDALPVFRDCAHERFEALCLLKRATAWQALGQRAQAIQDLTQSLPIFRRLRLTHFEKQVSGMLDECLAAAGE